MSERTLRVTIQNIAPDDGVFFSPTWVAIQSGEFDIFDEGQAASGTFIEGLAEDANTTGITTAFSDSAATGVQETIFGPTGAGFMTGDPVETQFVVEHEVDRFFSYGSMILPSNDAFIANPEPIEIFDAEGELIEGIEILVTGSRVWDAGTEVNDEEPDNTAALGQETPDTGDDEDGTVQLHPGFIGSVGEGSEDFGNILSSENFSNADFTTANNGQDYPIARFTFEFVPDIEGTGEGEVVDGTDDADIVNGLAGDDTVNGLDGNDLVIGGTGNDILRGGDGDDTLQGRRGFDRMLGGDGNDILLGGQGRDRINGGAGDDTLTGGASIDFFIFNTNDTFDTDDVGVDTITDFQQGIDFILLDLSTFDALQSAPSSRTAPGIDDDEFEVVETDDDAATSSALIVHSTQDGVGRLFYNENGDLPGFGDGGQFATVLPALTVDDFIIRA